MADPLQAAKQLVLAHTAAFDAALLEGSAAALAVLAGNSAGDYTWRGSHPFLEQPSAAAAVETFWEPLLHAMSPLQRRDDIFICGHNDVEGRETEVWTCAMGHFVGLFDRPFLGIPPTVVQKRLS